MIGNFPALAVLYNLLIFHFFKARRRQLKIYNYVTADIILYGIQSFMDVVG